MFRQNDVFAGTYRIVREIGRGGMSRVWLAYHLRLEKYVVIKRIRSDYDGRLDARTEVDILKNLRHPRLPQVYDFLQFGREVYTVMDHVEGRGLDTLVGRQAPLPERTVISWLEQLLDVLEYLHTRKPPVVHSDIKPSNIIQRPDGSLCLIDFNISLDGTGEKEVLGYSMYYAAPEQMRMAMARKRGQPVRYRLDGRTDLYSLAAVFFHLITGNHPMTDRPNPPLRQIAGGRYSQELLRILDKALQPDPGRRWQSARQMGAALERLRRKNSGFTKYVSLQAACLLASALLLGSGLFCVARGGNAAREEAYLADYKILSQAVEEGNDRQVLETGTEILRRGAYRSILESSPADHSAILHAIGDCFYNEEDYARAASCYRDALAYAEGDDPQLSTYYSDAAVALALAGDTGGAAELLEQAGQAGISSDHQLLIEASVAMLEGDSDLCVSLVRELTVSSHDASLCSRACLIAAQTMTGADRLAWLQTADNYSRTRQVLRQMGALCAELAEIAPTEEEAGIYLRYAREYYEALCGLDYAPLDDWLNLTVVQLLDNDNEAAVITLLELEEEYPGDYRIEMNLAFAYAAEGAVGSATGYGGAALRHWEETPETDRDGAYAESIQILRELLQQLGS